MTTTVSDVRRTDLYVGARTFIAEHGLHPDPDTYLAHGYVDLCLSAWPDVTGAPLHLATQWAIWTWLADDVFDTELRTATPQAVWALVARLVDVLDADDPTKPNDHPIVRALADLVGRTWETMPDPWWDRYSKTLEGWLHAAADKLIRYLQPGRTPTLGEYLLIRPVDGGMMLAAMWTELATQCVTPDWNTPLVQGLLRRFSTVGCLVNDLASGSGGDTFNAVDALIGNQGWPMEKARAHVREILHAEETGFGWLYFAVRQDFAGLAVPPGPVALDSNRFALHLDRFLYALKTWTASSSRYALAAPARVDR